MSGQHFFKDKQVLTLTFDHVTWKSVGVIYCLWTSTILSIMRNFPAKGSREIDRATFLQRPAIWSWPLTMWPEGSSTPYGHPPYQVWQLSRKGWVDNFCTKTNSLTLTFDQVTWKWVEVIYSLEAFTVPSFAAFKKRAQNTLSWHRLVYRPTNWQVQNYMSNTWVTQVT